MIKNKLFLYLTYWDVNNFYGWIMSQKLPVNCFEWTEDISEFDEGFIKSIMKKVTKEIFMKLIFTARKIYTAFNLIYHFYLKEWKLKNLKSLLLIYTIKLNKLST